jgi:hypothetical protein
MQTVKHDFRGGLDGELTIEFIKAVKVGVAEPRNYEGRILVLRTVSAWVALATVSMFLCACSQDAHEGYIQTLDLFNTNLSKVPPTVVATKPPPGGATVDFRGLRLQLPLGTAATVKNDSQGDKSGAFLEVTSSESAWKLYVVPYDQDLPMFSGFKPPCGDFEAVRRRYPSDLELVRAAYHATPDDLPKARTEQETCGVKALLTLKENLLVASTVEAKLPHLTLFCTRVPRSGGLIVELYDEAGRARCRLSLVPKDLDSRKEIDLGSVLRVLYDGSYP